MEWQPDAKNNLPVFRQIASYFEKQISSGKLSPGQPLPTERALAKEFSVNRSTMTAAYAELRASGLVQSVQGSGTRVSEHHWGVAIRPAPSWHEYTSGGGFQPTLPLIRRIREASLKPGIINLAQGELSPDLFPVEPLNELIHRMNFTGPFGYSNPQGDERLREALAQHVREEYGLQTTPNEILVSSGN